MINSTTSKTIEWLRFFCAVVVVYLHNIGSPLKGNDVIAYQNGAYDTIRILFSQGFCRVAVPIFFLISGYLFFIKLEKWDNKIWLEKFKKRLIVGGGTLLLPYLIWNLISILFSLITLKPMHMLLGQEVPDIQTWFNDIGGLRAFWDQGRGYHPYNYPLWFIRDLIVFVILTPVIYQFVKRLKIWGMIVLYAIYVIELWSWVPGFSAEGLFFFTLGAFFSTNQIDFISFSKKYWLYATPFACGLLIAIVLSKGNDEIMWGYYRRLFTFFGSIATIGLVAKLMEGGKIEVNKKLSNSSFFVFAAHGTIVLPLMQLITGRLLPINQFGLIVKYFTAPLLTVILLVIVYSLLSKWFPKLMAILTGGRVG